MPTFSDLYSENPERLKRLKERVEKKLRILEEEEIRNMPTEHFINFISNNFIAVIIFLYAIDNRRHEVGFENYDENIVYAKSYVSSFTDDEFVQEWDLSPYIPEKDLPFFYYILEYAESYDIFGVYFYKKDTISISLIEGEVSTQDEFSYVYNYNVIEDIGYRTLFYDILKKTLEENYDEIYKRSIKEFVISNLISSPFSQFIRENHPDIKYFSYGHNMTEEVCQNLYDIFVNEYCLDIVNLDSNLVGNPLRERFNGIIKEQQ